MGERETSRQIPEHKVGDSFQPFKELVVFSAINIDREEVSQKLFANEFTFNGVACSLSVNTFPYGTLTGIDTPLGKVRIVKSSENGKERSEEVPINLYLSAEPPSFEKYEELGGYALEFDLGGNKYYLSFGGDDPHIARQNFDGECVDYLMKNKDAEIKDVALPFNPDLIRDLNVNLVQKDMGPKRIR